MNTPITDDCFKEAQDCYPSDFVVPAYKARMLELDRAALMEFLLKLDELANDDECGSSDFRKTCRYDIPKALSAARANFPEP